MMNWLNNLGFGMLSNPLQQAEAGGIGGGMPSQPKPTMPQAQPNRFLNDPAMSNALMRMGGAILTANSQGAGFGGSLGAGATAFADGLQQGQEGALRRAQIEAEQAKAKRESQFGVRSAGFEGDIARAMVVMNTPTSTDEEKRVAQSIIQTAERMQGAYDPVSGEYRYNRRAMLPLELQRPATAGMMTAPAVQEAPLPPAGNMELLPAPAGDVLLPPRMDGQPNTPANRVSFTPAATSALNPSAPATDEELRAFGFIPTGNRKTDAENRAAAIQARINSMSNQGGEARQRITDAAALAQNATGILTKLDEAEGALQAFPTGFAGNIRGAGRQVAAALGVEGADQAAQGYETISRLSKELGAEGLKQFGGSDTQMELKVAIETAIDPNARPESNRRVIEQKRTAMQIIAEKPTFMEQYRAANGTMEGFEKAWMDYQKQQWDAYKGRANTGSAPQDDPFGLRGR